MKERVVQQSKQKEGGSSQMRRADGRRMERRNATAPCHHSINMQMDFNHKTLDRRREIENKEFRIE